MDMRRIWVLIIIIIALLGVGAARAETVIKAELDKTSVTTDQDLTYKLVITSTERKVPVPEIPKFEDFVVLSNAQSSTVSLAKTSLKTILVYAFVLAPTKTGKFKIGPATLKMGDKVLSSDTLEVEVKQGKGKSRVKPQTPALPKKTQPLPGSDQPQVTL